MMHSVKMLTLIGALASSITACFPTGKGEINKRRSGALDTLIEEGGVVTRALNPDAKITQAIMGASGSEIESTKVTFPPGSINIAMKISLEEASPIATPATVGQFDLNSVFVSAGKAVGVTSDVATDAVNPFTIALPVPTSALHLEDPLDKLAIVFKIKVAATGEIKTGIVPRNELTVANGFVNIETMYFGVYQAVLMNSVVETRLEASVSHDLQMKRDEKNLPALQILSRDPVVVKKGATITLTGKNFRPTMTLAWNGSAINKIKYASDSAVSFTAPKDGALGLTALNIMQDGIESSVSIVFQGDGSTLIGSFKPDQICSDVTYYDLNGKSAQGTRNCTSTPSGTSCTYDGEVGCVTTASFKAAKLSNFAASDIKTEVIVAGVVGSATLEGHTACISDGAINCVTTASYKAADMTNVIPGNIKDAVVIAGISGSLTGSPINCSANGEVGCIATTTFKAADLTNLVSANIKNNVAVAGVVGTYPSLVTPLDGATPTADLTSLAGTTPPGNYEFWDSTGAYYTGSIADAGNIVPNANPQSFAVSLYRQFTVAGDSNLQPGKIKTGISIFGVAGSMDPETHVSCSADGSTNCIASTAFVAVDKNILTPTNIKSGTSIGGIMGSYGPSCSSDGQQNCLAVTPFKAANPSAISPWDIRKGVTVLGVTGEIFFPRNMANLTTFNRTTGTSANTSITVADIYDTIDDGNNTGIFPIANPTGWAQSTGANWVMDTANDSNSNGLCDGAEACVFKDRLSGLMWAKDDGMTYTWETAITQCENLTYGTYTDWRVPSQKEMMQAYTNGIWKMNATDKLNLSEINYWTATTSSIATTNGAYTALNTGIVEYQSKASSIRAICVR